MTNKLLLKARNDLMTLVTEELPGPVFESSLTKDGEDTCSVISKTHVAGKAVLSHFQFSAKYGLTPYRD